MIRKFSQNGENLQIWLNITESECGRDPEIQPKLRKTLNLAEYREFVCVAAEEKSAKMEEIREFG